MQASQRESMNHALEYGILRANALNRPLVAYFGLIDDYPEANLRHYAFMLEGLCGVREALESRGVQLVVRKESPSAGVVALAREACLVITDRGYTRVQKAWREQAAEVLECPLIQVESDVIVPVEEASVKEEYAAATLRPKIKKMLDMYLVPVQRTPVKKDSLGLRFSGISLENSEKILSDLRVDCEVPPVSLHRGGRVEALRRLNKFISHGIDLYHERNRDPSLLDGVSHLSPHLHFGQISPLEIALRVGSKGGPGKDTFLEELIIRRELSINFVSYNPMYDQYGCLPLWARKTLDEHSRDSRERLYTKRELTDARTHDPYWNAAQREMLLTGKMHGYMRMYWGKKILEWSRSPQRAFETALSLNNRYELDGRDPNGFAGVAWCFGKHDRAWAERPVFGKVRYMNANGLRRKFNMDVYVTRIERLSDSAQQAATGESRPRSCR